MASINKERAKKTRKENGRKTILIVCADRKRRSIRLGKMGIRTAGKIKIQLEYINAAKCGGVPMDREQADWLLRLAKSGSELYDRISAAGLCQPREPVDTTVPLGKYLAEYMKTEATDNKASTVEAIERAKQNLIDKFGDDRDMRSITLADARERRRLAREGNELKDKEGKPLPMADNTVRRRVGRCRQFFNQAIEDGLITSNPFVQKRMPASTQRNDERMVFVEAEAIEECIKEAHSAD
jgi:hypothetical protein